VLQWHQKYFINVSSTRPSWSQFRPPARGLLGWDILCNFLVMLLTNRTRTCNKQHKIQKNLSSCVSVVFNCRHRGDVFVTCCVCVSVCLCICKILQKVVNGFWWNFWRGRAWSSWTNGLDLVAIQLPLPIVCRLFYHPRNAFSVSQQCLVLFARWLHCNAKGIKQSSAEVCALYRVFSSSESFRSDV